MAEPMVACGWEHTIFVKNNGTGWGCGSNRNGQLGLTGTANRYMPEWMNIKDIKQVVCGQYHSIFLKTNGTVWGCGQNTYGQLGLGDKTNRTTPVQINITNVKEVACGSSYTVFLKGDGTVWACGWNNSGQLGLGDKTDRYTPVQVNITNVKQVACGNSYTIFLKNNGTTWGCGWNRNGELGLGDKIDRTTSVQLNISNVKLAACGFYHTIFLKNDGTVWGCGGNSSGQLGLEGTTNRITPVQLNIKDIKQVACGQYHSIFLKTNGAVWGCGINNNGQLGLGDNTNQLTPMQLNMTNVKQVACGNNHTIFLKYDGTFWDCGYNNVGQLGLGDVVNRKVPTLIENFVVHLMLLHDLDRYKTISERMLQTLANQVLTADNFERNGFADISDIKNVWEQLGEQFDVIIYDVTNTNDSITVNHLPPVQLIEQTEDIDLSTYSNIKNMTMATAGSRGTIKLVLSFDSGTSWKTYTNGWKDIELTAETIMSSGLTAATLSAITAEQWMEVATDTLRIAYCLSKTAIADDIAIDSLTITGDTAAWERAAHMTDYDYEYPNTTTLVVHLLSDGSYKINYMEAK